MECRMLIDATETALLAHLADVDFETPDGKAVFSTTVEFYQAGKIPSFSIAVPAELGVEGNQVEIHKGYRGGGHIYVVCQVRAETVVATPIEATRREYEIRDKAIKVAAYLRKNITAFGEAKLTAISHEAEGRKSPVMKQGRDGWARKFDSTKVTPLKSGEPGGEFDLSTFAESQSRLMGFG